MISVASCARVLIRQMLLCGMCVVVVATVTAQTALADSATTVSSQPVSADASPVPLILPSSSPLPTAAVSASPGVSTLNGTSGSVASPAAPVVAPTPQLAATPVPIIVDPPQATVPLGGAVTLHARGVLGQMTATPADPQLLNARSNQDERSILLQGLAPGHTEITVTDQRGMSRTVPIFVAPLAGYVGTSSSVQVTGSPASGQFLLEVARRAALDAAHLAPGAVGSVGGESAVPDLLEPDTITTLRVPLTLSGPGLYPVSGVTNVQIENLAEPPVKPGSLIVSDFPEKLSEPGLLFTSDLTPTAPVRLMFYHYNPAGQPNRHIVLRVKNSGPNPAKLQIIDGHGGPNSNEMLVGHIAAQRFLVNVLHNEGILTTIPGNATSTVVDAPLPAGDIVNDLMQIRQIDGENLRLYLSAEDSDHSVDLDNSPLLTAHEHHARGIYPIPQFFYETTYTVGLQPVEIQVGQLPLPNLRHGETLVGDYAVQETIDAAITNPTNEPADIALYANPRGGKATGTFIIDQALVQAHALPVRSTFKLRQYHVPAHGVINVQIITIPEGGSSYPLELIFAPDDGSVAPGAPGSPIY